MTKEELYLKTVFCCIACDGDIATEEVDMVRELCANLHKNSIYKPVEIKNQIPFPRVFAKMRI